MLKAHFHENTRSIGDWSLGSRAYELYIGGMTSIRGVDILQNGIAAVSIQWRSNTNRYDPIKLFGKVEVPISEVFRLEKKFLRNNKAAQSAMITTMEYKRAVGDFFVSQLLLCSEMCLGRNYPVMQKLEKLYSFDMLFSMLKMTHSDILKSAATSLLLTLYVDRDPQKVIQLPRLTRTWTEVSTMTVVDIVSVPQNSMHTFGLLQYTISEHLRGIKGRQYPRHTYNTLRLLMKLIDFNFYGSVARMTETIELLVSNLKRDDYDLEVDSEVSGVFTSVMKLVNSVTSRKAPSLRRSILSSKSLLSEPGVLARAQSAFIAIDSFQDESTSAKSIKEFLGLDMQIDTHILHILESSDATMFMVVLTLISLAIDTFSYVSGVYHVGIRIFQFFVLFVYVFEFLLHFCLHLMVRRRVSDFFTNVNTWIDLVNVTLYGIVFILLKLVPFVQTVRLLRLPSFGVQYYQHRRQEKEALSQKTLGCSWVEPDRYFKTSEITISSIIKIVQTLNVIQSNIEDYYLSLLLKEFMRWYKDPKSTAADVFDIFQSVVGRSTELSVSNAEWDGIYIDLLMYSSATLVQKTLSLLMIHHSSLQLFSKNISKLQLITTSAGEAQYFKMERLLNRLKQEAETHDIWGHLLTEEHRKISDEIHEYLQVLTSDCKKRREILTFDEAEEPVVATQNILRNLGCFDVCMKIVQLIGSINHNDTLNEAHINTRKLAKSCNNLLYWFIHDNPSNQELAFKHLGFFIKSIDENIDSHKVISAIFQNNIELIEGVPKKHIADFVSLICSNGRFPQYLSLLNSIITVGEKNVIANQYEVIRLLSSPENQKKVVQYFVPVKHPEYAKKVRSMLPYMNSKDLSVDELPSDLAYHLELMRLLNGCTVGRSGMTTIEAKVQSMFFFVDVIEAMLDTNCLLLAKIRLGQYLYNAMIDVETYLPGFKDADCTWKLLYTFPDVFLFAKDELRQIEKNGWEAQTSNRQKIEYVLVCAVIVSGYFSEYYDHTIFKQEVGQITFGVERVAIKEAQANELIKSLFLKISAIYEMVSPLLAREHHEILFQALVVLNEKASQSIVAEVEKIHDEYMNLTNTDLIHDPEQEAAEKFLEFSAALNSDQRVKELVDKQLQSFIERLEEIPSKTVTSMSNVRFEPLIEKLVMHIRRSVRVVMHGDDTIKSMSPESTKTSVWLVKIFRTMVENRWGMDIYGRDDDGGEEEDNAVVELMKVFSASGMTEMCLDIIAKGIDMNLQVCSSLFVLILAMKCILMFV